jgi:hypothetical protein
MRSVGNNRGIIILARTGPLARYHLIECLRCTFLSTRQNPGVYFHSNTDIRMPKSFLDLLGMFASLQKTGSVYMTQILELDPGNISFLL